MAEQRRDVVSGVRLVNPFQAAILDVVDEVGVARKILVVREGWPDGTWPPMRGDVITVNTETYGFAIADSCQR